MKSWKHIPDSLMHHKAAPCPTEDVPLLWATTTCKCHQKSATHGAYGDHTDLMACIRISASARGLGSEEIRFNDHINLVTTLLDIFWWHKRFFKVHFPADHTPFLESLISRYHLELILPTPEEIIWTVPVLLMFWN